MSARTDMKKDKKSGEKSRKKPGVLYRIFFKSPAANSPDEEQIWQPSPEDEWPQGGVSISQPISRPVSQPISQPITPLITHPQLPFGAPPTIKKWLKLAIASEEINAEVELAAFPVEIGSVQSSIRLRDNSISPRHAVMDLHNGILTITDTHSQNGVSIGSIWLSPGIPYPVNPGDTILVGRTRITVMGYAGRSEEKSLPQPDTPHINIIEPTPPMDVVLPEDILNALDADFMAPVLQEEEPEDVELPPEPESEVEPELELEVEPEIEPEPEPEPIFEPEPEPEPEFKAATLKKLMEESSAVLFRDVLGMKEPEPPEEEPEPLPEEPEPPEEDDEYVPEENEAELQSTEDVGSEDVESEDMDSEDVESKDMESKDAPPQENEDELEPESTEEPLTTDVPTPEPEPPSEQSIEDFLETLLLTTKTEQGDEQNPEGTPDSEPSTKEDEIPQDLSTEEFLEALMQKSTRRPPPSWRAAEQPTAEPPTTIDEPTEAMIEVVVEPPGAVVASPNKICPKCSTTSDENDKFCAVCGTPISAPPPPPEVKAFCGQCGTGNVHKLKFCGECGNKLT